MSPVEVNAPFVNSIVHPTDFSKSSERAFAHALSIALIRHTSFTVMHVGGSLFGDPMRKFPQVRETLKRWGFLEGGGQRAEVYDKARMRVKKVNLSDGTVLGATTRFLDKNPTDMIVLATRGRDGIPSWLKPSVSQRLTRKTNTKTLFVPGSVPGFVSPRDGTISLRRIVVPIDHAPDSQAAVVYASRAAGAVARQNDVEIILLHVGSGQPPKVVQPQLEGCTWAFENRVGPVVEQIVGAAEDLKADLLVLATAGHQDFLDGLRGSVTEQVIRNAPCPVLAVPTR